MRRMRSQGTSSGQAGAWTGRVGVAVLALGLAAAACSNPLDVEPPDRVSEDQLNDPTTASLQVRSLEASFGCAYAQYIVTTGEVSDELVNSNLNSSQAFEFDARNVGPDNENYARFECDDYNAIYTPLSTSLVMAEETLERLRDWDDSQVPDRSQLIATTLAYSAYGRVWLGEAFCSAAINMSEELSSQQILEQAEQRFTEAIEAANQVGDDQLLNMARVGRARVRRDLGDSDGALSDAGAVPEGFVYDAQYSSQSERSRNQVYQHNQRTNAVSVDSRFRNPTYEDVADPRVQAVNSGQTGSGRIFEVWYQQKYPSLETPIPIASWEEAQLIIAEIEGGQTAEGIINDLHDRAGLPDFDGASESEISAHVIQERSRELFLEGQRMWDIRRFEIALEPVPGTAYPKGGTYGDMRCFPLPDAERFNNPNIG